MDAAPGRAQACGQVALERGVHVLVGELDVPATAGVLGGQLVERRAHAGELVRAEQALRVQHLGVRQRGAHIVGHETLIEREVLARAVAEHLRIERHALVPQPRHGGLCCSAGLSALMSATIMVPVPSLVNTSPRMPSGAR